MDDHRAIEALKARYCRYLDTKRWDDWGALFTPDAVIDTTDSGGPRFEGRDVLVEFVRGSLGEARTVHQVHSPEIAIDGDKASGIWAMYDRIVWPNGMTLTGYGHYHERYAREGGEWRIAESRLTRLLVETDREA